MSQATDVLRHEHDAILLALKILNKISDEVSAGKTTADNVAIFLDWLREFSDTCHHGKEEGLLFPAMIEAGQPAEGGSIAEMLSDHEEGRTLIVTMAAATTPAMKPVEFSKAATAYIAHMREHIDKENNVVFPLADQVIDPKILDGLVAAFDRHEEEVMGHGRHEQLHDMLDELKVKYLDS